MKLSRKFDTKKPKTVEGDIFSMPFKSETFDFVWNIGVIEHYSDKYIISLLGEMLRVCRDGGAIAVGVPNFYSGPILKAAILRWKLFSFIPGYRLDTERFFRVEKIEDLIRKACTNVRTYKTDCRIDT